MAFKEITNASMGYWHKKVSERKVGDKITGKYVRKDNRVGPDGSQSVLYILETKEGMVGVNASATITRAMEQIPEGSTVMIEYDGKARSTKTGREYNNFKVYLDDGDQKEDVSVTEDTTFSDMDF